MWLLRSSESEKELFLCCGAGTVEKKPLSDADVQLVVALLQRLRPRQLFAAGDLSDPHGTHRTCLQVRCKLC